MRLTLILALLGWLAGCATSIETMVRKAGYAPVKLGSGIYEPGTVFRASTKTVLCRREHYAPGLEVHTRDGENVSTNTRQLLSGKLVVNNVDGVPGAQASAKYFRRVVVELENIEERYITESELRSAAAYQTIGCSEKLASAPRNDIVVVAQSLRADVSFDAQVKSEVDVGTQNVSQLKDDFFAAIVGAGGGRRGGKNMFWGTKSFGEEALEINTQRRTVTVEVVAVESKAGPEQIELPHSGVSRQSTPPLKDLQVGEIDGDITYQTDPAWRRDDDPESWGYINAVEPHPFDRTRLMVTGALRKPDKSTDPPTQVKIRIFVPLKPRIPAVVP